MDITELDDFPTDQLPTGDVQFGFVLLEDKDLCHMDTETISTLELLSNNADLQNRRHTLFGYLNANLSTTVGSALLLSNIRNPFCHLETIEHRLDAIEYLVNRPDTLSMITNAIKPYGQSIDLHNLVQALGQLYKARGSSLGLAEKRLDALMVVETVVSRIETLVGVLADTDEKTLKIYMDALKDPAYDEILQEIKQVIDIDTYAPRKSKRSKVMRIRQGVESLFDIARSTYQAAIEEMEQYVQELRRDDGHPWKLSWHERRGYFLSLSVDHLPKRVQLHERYMHVDRTRTQITCVTKDLMQSNVRANISYENSMKLANEILSNSIASLMSHFDALTKLVSVVGHLDLVTGFAKLAICSNGSMVRPMFNATQTILEQSRHPVLETVLTLNNLTITPNDASLAIGRKNFMLVSGPNMGGKSIFLKQIAVIQVMAQMGCFVPAKSAEIKIMNRIVSRSGSTDDSKSNCSSFTQEMRGIATAIHRDDNFANQSVLYVIDEIGRGTTIDDGASYSFAIAEELALRRNCFTIFATHFDQVFNLTALYGNVVPYHFEYRENESGRLKITHHLVPGLADKHHYGLKLAEIVGLPEEILAVARSGIDIAI